MLNIVNFLKYIW